MLLASRVLCKKRLEVDLSFRASASTISYVTSLPRHTRSKSSSKLPSYPARTRFAPSPTGYLHLGSLRTALYSYLLAKATNGQFILRIEDTDKTRTVPDAQQRLCEDLQWAGLQWDEGPGTGGLYGPYIQSERTRIYQENAEKLLRSGNAYRCFCSANRINRLAKQQNALGLPLSYDRHCLALKHEEVEERVSKGEASVIRLKEPDVFPEYTDIVSGFMHNDGPNAGSQSNLHGQGIYEDPILMKSDGLPTYHLANVVDDHLMQITHVIRASEWQLSTFKHLVLYQAFGWQPPEFAHVGLLTDQEGQKLSKRRSDTHLRSLRNEGVLPEALLNYVVLHGWSHSLLQDFLPMHKLIENFDMKFTAGNSKLGNKLVFFQRKYAYQYITQGCDDKLQDLIDIVYSKVQGGLGDSPRLRHTENNANLRNLVVAVVRADLGRTPAPLFWECYQNIFYFKPRTINDECIMNDAIHVGKCIDELARALSQLNPSSWNGNTLQDITSNVADLLFESNLWSDIKADDIKKRKHIVANVHRCIRYALMGSNKVALPSVTLMQLLGQDNTISRLDEAATHINKILEDGVSQGSNLSSRAIRPSELAANSSAETETSTAHVAQVESCV